MKKVINKLHNIKLLIIRSLKLVIKEYIPNLCQLIFENRKIKSILSSIGIQKSQILNFKMWHLKYRYYVGFLNNKKVFIKVSTKNNWLKHEYDINNYIEKNSTFLTSHKVKTYFYEKKDNYEFLVEEYIDLKKLGEINTRDLIHDISRQIVMVVKELQRINLYYIDFYEDNIFIDDCANIKLFDFGFSVIKNQKLNFIDKVHDLNLIYQNINPKYRLDIGIIDDAFSAFEILKKIDPDFINTCKNDYNELINLQEKLIFDFGVYNENK